MPRQLLHDGAVVEDEWTYAKDLVPPESPSAAVPTHLILAFEQWQLERDHWSTSPSNLGVILLPAHKIEDLAPDLGRFKLVAAEFPGPSDGRGYTQGRLLRERYAFKGEVRAIGYVRYDQIFFLARCGFNSFELSAADLTQGSAAFNTFSWRYQPSNDVGLPRRLGHR